MSERINWFRQWFNAMPEHWQRGLLEAIEGGAFMGELPCTQKPDVPQVVVFFVHRNHAEAVRDAIERKGGGS